MPLKSRVITTHFTTQAILGGVHSLLRSDQEAAQRSVERYKWINDETTQVCSQDEGVCVCVQAVCVCVCRLRVCVCARACTHTHSVFLSLSLSLSLSHTHTHTHTNSLSLSAEQRVLRPLIDPILQDVKRSIRDLEARMQQLSLQKITHPPHNRGKHGFPNISGWS